MTRPFRVLGALVVAVVLGGFALAQEPQGPPPPSGTASRSGADTLELLPDLGKIGAEVGALAGASWNPYGMGRGYSLAGFIDLPLARLPGGKLSYEILLGFSDASRLRLLDTSPFGLKYTITRLDRARLRPYVDGGVEVVLAVIRERGRGDVTQPDRGSRNRASAGLSDGASLEVGFHAGGGFEIRVSRGLSLNLDYRFTRLGDANLHVAEGGLGIHW